MITPDKRGDPIDVSELTNIETYSPLVGDAPGDECF